MIIMDHVASRAFETGAGLCVLYHLAAELYKSDNSHGLGKNSNLLFRRPIADDVAVPVSNFERRAVA